ncbi:MAG: hypothetical protein ACM3Q4_02955 [Acidobacteriota bacterium]
MTAVLFLPLFSTTDAASDHVHVVGVMNHFSWNGGAADPLAFTMQVSATTKQNLTAFFATPPANTDVEIQFDIYAYDPAAASYYRKAHSCGVKLYGLIQKMGGELQAFVEQSASEEVLTPSNFQFYIGIVPQAFDQVIGLGSSATMNIQKSWGVTVASSMSSLSKTVATDISCDVQQGFNFTAANHAVVGYVTSMKIGTLAITPDIIAPDMASALPVELNSFTAASVRGRVELAWSTAGEVNNCGFDVERRMNGEWTRIGFVEGAGTTNVPQRYTFVDAGAKGNVSYRLRQIDRNGGFAYTQTVDVEAALTPEDYRLSQNYPNPFNPSTTLTFAMREAEYVRLTVHDILGREAATLFEGVARPNEFYRLRFDAKDLPGGTYFYRLRSASRSEAGKMTLMK